MKKFKIIVLMSFCFSFGNGCSNSSNTSNLIEAKPQPQASSQIESTGIAEALNTTTDKKVQEESDIQDNEGFIDIQIYETGKRLTSRYHYDPFCYKVSGLYSSLMLSEIDSSITLCDYCCTEEIYNQIIEALNSDEQVLIADNFRLSNTYHLESCDYLKTRSTRILTKQQAIDMELEPCSKCNP